MHVRQHMRPPRFGRLWVNRPEASIVATLYALVSDVCRYSLDGVESAAVVRLHERPHRTPRGPVEDG